MSYKQRRKIFPEAINIRMDYIPELRYNRIGKEKNIYDSNIDISSIVDIDGDFLVKTSNEILERPDARGIFEGNRRKFENG